MQDFLHKFSRGKPSIWKIKEEILGTTYTWTQLEKKKKESSEWSDLGLDKETKVFKFIVLLPIFLKASFIMKWGKAYFYLHWKYKFHSK